MNKDYHEIGLMLDKKHEFVDFVLYCEAKSAVLCVSKSKESRRRRCFCRSFSDDKYREIDLPFHAINITLISSRVPLRLTIPKRMRLETFLNCVQSRISEGFGLLILSILILHDCIVNLHRRL